MKSKKQFSRKNKSKKQIRKKIKGGVETTSSNKTFTKPRGHYIPPPISPLDDPITENVPDQLQDVNQVAPPLHPSSEGPIMGRVVSDSVDDSVEVPIAKRVISHLEGVPIAERVVPNIPTSNAGISYFEEAMRDRQRISEIMAKRREEYQKKLSAEQRTRRRASSTNLSGPGGPGMEVGYHGVDVDCGNCVIAGGKRKTNKRKTRRLKTRRRKTRKH